MTVQQLINILGDFEPGDKVYFQQSSGDYWRSQLAREATGVDEVAVVYSDYHQALKLVGEGDVDEDDDGDPLETVNGKQPKKVVLIQGMVR